MENGPEKQVGIHPSILPHLPICCSACECVYVCVQWSPRGLQYNFKLSNNESGPRFNIKMSSYQYSKSHCGDKTVLRSSYLHKGIPYTGKMSSLYWFSPQKLIPNCLYPNIYLFNYSLWSGFYPLFSKTFSNQDANLPRVIKTEFRPINISAFGGDLIVFA